MPYWAAWSVQRAAIPGSPIQFTPRAKYPNAKNTAIAPRNAPMSGLVRSRESAPVRTSRSSGRAVGAAVSAMSFLQSGPGRAAARRPPRDRSLLARALRGERGDPRRIRLVDDSRPGQHRLAVADRVEVRDVEDREDDRQVPLEVLLLVDREQHPPLLDLLDRAADVERPCLRALRDHVEARDRDVGVEAEEAVERLVGLERGLHLGLRARDVGPRGRHRHHLDGSAPEHRLDAVRALHEGRVARLVDDDQHLLRTGRLELLAGALA